MYASERLTVERIARALDISSTTVSRALSGKGRVSEATRTRVLEYISRSGGDTTLLDRRREERATHNLALVIPSHFVQLDLPFLRKCMGGVCRMAAQRGYDILLCYADPLDTVQLERQLRARKVDGVILSRTMVEDPCLTLVRRYGVPYVVLGHVPDITALQVDNDQTGAAYELTRLLLQMGLRRLAFMGGSMDYTVNQDRMQGYRQALAEYGAAPERGLIRTGVEARDQIPDALEGLLEQYPDCILCSDDTMALNVLADLNRRGIGVPAQLRLASFYDSESLLTASPPVTAAQFDAALLGSTACRLLMDFMAGKEVTARQVQGYQVVLRESTK